LDSEGRYNRQLLRGDQRIMSSVFPNLNLTVKAILGVG
jgi:Uma2 family endonuclease